MIWQYLIIAPWVVVLPVGFFLLLRRNYRSNSGLCVSCGAGLSETSGCDVCSQKHNSSRFRVSMTIILMIWVFTSFGVFRNMALS